MPNITSCSVRVMRSFDYCHFEIVLGGTAEQINSVDVDALRKRAVRLADKAVEQYKIARENEQLRERDASSREYLEQRMERIQAMNEGDRTVDQQAELKVFKDTAYNTRRVYDYEDDWQEQD